MKDYYEELWYRLPERLEPPEFELRRRFLMAALEEGRRGAIDEGRRAAPEHGQRVLDLGCGEATFTALIAAAGASVVGVEIAEAALSRARARDPELDLRLVSEDGPLPFGDNSFELVWASEVIEHVADTGRWLSEVRRVLAPGGRLLVTTPAHGRLAVLLWGVERFSDPLGDHLHLYTKRSLAQLLREFDFAEVRIRAAAGPPLVRRLLLASARR